MSEESKIKAFVDLGEPGLQYIEPKSRSLLDKILNRNKPRHEAMLDSFYRSYGKLRHFLPHKKSLWEKFKDLFKREYKKKEIFNKDGELDVKALMSNFKNKKKEPERIIELSELYEGYIHAPYLPVMNPPTLGLNGKPSGMTELIVDTEETNEDE